ncbi:hypothetical protein D3C81_2011750 [compost metagenome]
MPNTENLRITAASVTARAGRFTWDVSGTSQTRPNTITVTANTASGVVTLGTATVSLAGNWRVLVSNTLNPGTAATVTARSTAGSTVTAPVGP